MAGTSSINIKGIIDVTTQRRTGEVGLAQIMDEIEVKQLEAYVPRNTTSPQSVTLPFSPGVTEALYIHIYSAKPVILELTYTDTDNSGSTAGPTRRGLKGHMLNTYVPGEGLVSLGVINLSANDDAQLDIVMGSKQRASDTPSFWD